MDMKVNATSIKKMRNEKMWSQEQLAEMAGIGLRTLQRVEAQGSASNETVKAIAAVFDVDAQNLLIKESSFTAYKHRQWGVGSAVAVIIIMAIINGVIDTLTTDTLKVEMMWGIIALNSILLAVAIVFSSMTIEVNQEHVKWSFCFGIGQKYLAISEVDTAKPVKNPLWMGLGIHSFGTGWIYNVSGLLGVEIALKGGSFLRLGTDEPNYLAKAINDAKS